MEPLAPGTEDEPLYNQVNIKPSKKETAEEHALSKKAYLPNGSYGAIFELNYVQGAQHWYCKVCECPVLGKLFNHEIGKRHTANLEHWNKRTDAPGKDVATPSENSAMETASIVVAPGEPVPPGFEGEIEKTTMIQERLDGFNVGPLVGLEYLLELLDYDPSKEPSYLCILCDKKGDPRTVLTHLSSYNHQVMYLQKHFPTVYRHIAPFMIKQYKRNWQSGLQRIADAIEATFGRLKPMQVEAGKFEKDRMHYIEIVAKGKHFSELMGHTFEDVVPKEELIKTHEDTKPYKPYDSNLPFQRAATSVFPKRKSPSPPVVARPIKKQKPEQKIQRKKSLSPVSDISSSDLEDYEPKKPIEPQKQERNPKERGRSPIGRRRSPSPPKRKEGPMPWQKSNYVRGKVANADRNRDVKTEKMEEYKKLSKAIDNDMEQVLKKHKQNPEKHPKYNDEWKKFWNSRYKELQSEGKNASTHDFKPEWIEFWNKRILELHQEDIKNKKIALRRRLGLPDEPAPISFKIGERRRPGETTKGPLPTAAQPDNDPEVIVIEDNDRDSRSPPKTSSSRRKSRSPYGRRGREFSPQYRRRSPPSLTRRGRNISPISPPHKSGKRSRDRSTDLERISPTPLKNSPPPTPSMRRRRSTSRGRKYSPDRSPERFVRLRDRSDDRSKSRGRSREISWEKERHRDYDESSWERSYRVGRNAPWDGSSSSHRYVKIVDPYAPPKILRDVTREPVLDPLSDDDDEVNIVAVLRLLTALEEKLGSLGPKVIELLGQALALEKKAANSSEQLLDSEINCVLFETVKEKLKGQLLAGFVDGIKERAFKRAIKKTASLIHAAGERKKKREDELPKKPVVVPGVGSVDKGKIARQIANALIAQGKTDVTQDELEQLINAVVGIAEAQKNSSQPITTAAFLEKLSTGSIPANETKPEEKIPAKSETKPTESTTTTNETKTLKKPDKNIEENDASSQDKIIMNMEGLSDSDLQTLLQNFKDLSTDEQHGLINYLKKLEAKEPERVEKLRKFVDMTDTLEEKKENERYSPFSNRTVSINPTSKEEDNKEENATSTFVQIDSEEEDYSFDDVAKAASKNVIETEMERKRIAEETKKETDDKNLNDAKALISSLMSSLNKTNNTNLETKQENSAGKINIISNVPVSSTEIVNSLGGITMSVSSLGSILGNVQNMQQNQESKIAPLKPNQQQQFQQENKTRNNPYDDFDITSQRDIRMNKMDFNNPHLQQQGMGHKNDIRPAGRTYDEFNIEPNEFRDDMNYGQRDERGSQFMNRQPIGYPMQQDRLPPLSLDRKAPTLNFRPPPFQNNAPSVPYPTRGGPQSMRPLGGNNFESRDYAPSDRSDFMRSEQRMNEPSRVGVGDYHRNFNDMRGGDYRGGQNNFRGGPSSNEPPHRGGNPRSGGLLIDPNRLGNAPPQRFGGGNGGFNNNSFSRW